MKLKWSCHIPLIGGMCIAGINTFKSYPQLITSYSPFNFNDSLLIRYLKDKHNISVPYYHLDKEEIIPTAMNIIVGVPPCSGLSLASSYSPEKRKECKSNDWMIDSLEFILSKAKPDLYVFENAPQLFTNLGLDVRKKLESIMYKNNYSVTYFKTNTLLHGVPQKRERTYAIFIKGNRAPILNLINKPLIPLKDWIKQIPKSASLQDQFLVKEPNIDEFEIVQFYKSKWGNNWRDKVLEIQSHVHSHDFLRKMNLLYEFKDFLYSNSQSTAKVKADIDHIIKKVEMGKNYRVNNRIFLLDKEYTYTVIGGMMQGTLHPIENRIMNIREYMHLMGLPHDFELYSKKEYEQIPRNVPVQTTSDILNECKEILLSNRELSNESILFIDNTKPKQNSKFKKLF